MDCDVAYEELARLAADELEPERATELKGHAQACGPCRRRLAALRQLDGALAALPRMEPRPSTRRECR